MASLLDSGDRLGWSATNAATQSGPMRACWRNAQPMPLRRKKSGSPMFASIA
jgi:hypothetical protein